MKRDTRMELQLAISRIKHGRPKVVDRSRRLSIVSVAEEASLSPATIHNRHPDIAQMIRDAAIDNTEPASTRKSATKVDKLKELREALEKREADFRTLASINLRLSLELDLAKKDIKKLHER